MKHFTSMKGRWGFTLIEMIGVLAIMAILASVMAPNLIRQINDQLGEAETANLKALADTLQQYILTNRSIPSPSNWATDLATLSELPAVKVQNNDRGFSRGYYADPRFFTTSDTVFSGYTQSTGLTTAPVSPRILLVSSLKGNAPAAPATSAEFSAIWDQTAAAAVKEDTYVKVQRINLAPLFNRVILTNQSTSQLCYRLETGATTPLPSSNPVTIYVLRATRINLYADPCPGVALDYVTMADGAASYAYQPNGMGGWNWGRP